MSKLKASFSSGFAKDVKRISRQGSRDLAQLEEVIDLVLENTAESLETLRRRHRMHTLSGKWSGSRECHVANAGDWLLIWADDGISALFQRTGTHNELFR